MCSRGVQDLSSDIVVFLRLIISTAMLWCLLFVFNWQKYVIVRE